MEKLKPFSTKINFIRLLADMQVCSTYLSVKKILRASDFAYLSDVEKYGGGVLDVGCGNMPYKFLFDEKLKYTGIDWDGAATGFGYDNSSVIHYDGVHFPFVDETFDLVFHTEVAEHIQDIFFFFKECYRVLKKDSKLLFSMPFMARYHYIPHDYWRLTPSSIKMILENSGFKNIAIATRGTDITVACYKVLSVGYRYFLSKNIFKILFALVLMPLWGCALLVGQFSLVAKVGETDDCLGYTVYAEK